MKRIGTYALAVTLLCAGVFFTTALAEEVKLTKAGIPTTWTPTWGTSNKNAGWIYEFYAGNIAEEGMALLGETGVEMAAWCGDGLWQEDFDAIIEACSGIKDPVQQIRCAWQRTHDVIDGYERAADAEKLKAFQGFGVELTEALVEAYIKPDAYVCRDYAISLDAILGELGYSSGIEGGWDGLSGHAWVEVYLDDGTTYVLDAYNELAIEIADE